MEVVDFSGFDFREDRHKDAAVIWMDFKYDRSKIDLVKSLKGEFCLIPYIFQINNGLLQNKNRTNENKFHLSCLVARRGIESYLHHSIYQ